MAYQPRSPSLRDYAPAGVNAPIQPHQGSYQQSPYEEHSRYNGYSAAGEYGYEEYGSNPYGDHQYSNDYASHEQHERQTTQYQDSNQDYNKGNGYQHYTENNPYSHTLQEQGSHAMGPYGERQSADAYDGIVDQYDSRRHPLGQDGDSGRNRDPLPSFESVRQKGSNQRPGIATRMDKRPGPETGRTDPRSHTAPSTPMGQSFQQGPGQFVNAPERLGSQRERLAPENGGPRPGTAPGTHALGAGRSEANGFDFSSKQPSRGDFNEQNPQRPPMRRGMSDNRYDTQQSYKEQGPFDGYPPTNAPLEDEEEMPNFQSTQEQSSSLANGPSQSSSFTPYRPAEQPSDHLQKSSSQPAYNQGGRTYPTPTADSIRDPPRQERGALDRNGYEDSSEQQSRGGPPIGANSRPMQPRERPPQHGQPPRRPRQPEGPSRSRTTDDYQQGRDYRGPGPGYGQSIPQNAMRRPPRGPMEQQRRPPRPGAQPRGPPGHIKPAERSERNQSDMVMRERQPRRPGPDDRYLDRNGRGGGAESSTGGQLSRPKTAGEAKDRGISGKDGQRPGLQERNSDGNTSRSPPAPVRPGLRQPNEGGRQPARPPPVRHYTTEASSGNASGINDKRKSAPITLPELNQLQDMARSSPSDHQLQLKLAKKLGEAAIVLADDGGHADPRTRDRNQERYNQDALKIVTKLVNENDPNAMFYLAECHGDGTLGLVADPKEAFNLYQSAAKLNHPAAAYRTAVCCEIGPEDGGGTRQDFQKAMQWYRRAASLGDVGGNYKMGIILLDGLLGQQRSVGEAVTHLKRAAERADEEHPHALYELGRLHESREYSGILPHDEKLALQEFTQAAKFGHRNSQFRLGKAYEYGLLTCPIDARNSIYWYTKAASQGQHESELALSGWYLTGSEGILDQSDTEAYLWARKAALAEPPLPKAMFAMGYFTEVGIGCPRSLDEAKRWYGRASSQNFQKAQERLEELNRGGANAQRGRERISRSNPKQNENCALM